LLCWGEFIPWSIGINAGGFTVAEEIALAIFSTLTLEGLDGSIAEGEEVVRDGFV